jgi:hypothetical protein
MVDNEQMSGDKELRRIEPSEPLGEHVSDSLGFELDHIADEMEKNVDWIQRGQWVAVHGSKEKVDELLKACYAAGILKDDLTIQEDEKYPGWCWYVCLTKALEAKTAGERP